MIKKLIFGILGACLLGVCGAGAQAAATLQLAQAQLGTGVQARQLTGAATNFAANSQVYLWLEVTGGPSDPITVTWKHGASSYDFKLEVKSADWHTWASKTVAAAGDWTVTVADASGNVLKTLSFSVGAAH